MGDLVELDQEFDDEVGATVTSKSGKPPKKKPTAKYKDYVEMFTKVLGPIRKDLFSGELMFWHKERDRWVPAFDDGALGKLEVFARESRGFYCSPAIDAYLHTLREQTQSELLVDFPIWDGKDRVSWLVSHLEITNIKTSHAADLVKDWGAKMIGRAYVPRTRNRMLTLKGPQNVGKDVFLEELMRGLGQFRSGFSLASQERDYLSQLCRGLVLHIAEIDRTEVISMPQLKHFITVPHVDYRPPYARREVSLPVRTSFTASCNVDTILRDHTGSSRYIILDITKINWPYGNGRDSNWQFPQEECAQILAQFKHLYETAYEPSQEAERALAEYLGEHTPDDPDEAICADWEAIMKERGSGLSQNLADEWDKLRKIHSRYSTNALRGILKRKGYSRHTRQGKIYYATKELKEVSQQLSQGVTGSVTDDTSDTQVTLQIEDSVTGKYEIF